LESKWQKGEFKQTVCIVETRPQKFVELKNGVFMQYKANKPLANKEVQRGWNGQVLETVTETTSIITTVTRDAIITGPGSPPYSKPLQPGVPFHSLNLQHANSLSEVQFVPAQTNGNMQQYPSNGNNNNIAVMAQPQNGGGGGGGGAPVYYQMAAYGEGGQPQQVQMMAPNGYQY